MCCWRNCGLLTKTMKLNYLNYQLNRMKSARQYGIRKLKGVLSTIKRDWEMNDLITQFSTIPGYGGV